MTFCGREATSWSNDASEKVVCVRVMYRFNPTQLNHPCSRIKLKIYIKDAKQKTCRFSWICRASKADDERVRGHTLEDKHWQNLQFVLKVFVVHRDDRQITAHTNRFRPSTTRVSTLKIRNPTRSNATLCVVAAMSLACCASIFSQPAFLSSIVPHASVPRVRSRLSSVFPSGNWIFYCKCCTLNIHAFQRGGDHDRLITLHRPHTTGKSAKIIFGTIG